MNAGSMRRKRIKALSRGKAKHVSLRESVGLRLAGCADGGRGLPRIGAEGNWTSAFMDREAAGYEEFCGQMWSLLQFEKETAYTRLGELMDLLPKLDHTARELRRTLEEARQSEPLQQRRRGEDGLTEDQVRARRLRERDQALAPLLDRLEKTEQMLTADAKDFSALYSMLEEEGNSIRMAIQRVREHTAQRLDIYWNAALKKHPEGDAMPPVPEVVLTYRSEETFARLHENLMARAAALQPVLAAIPAEMEAT